MPRHLSVLDGETTKRTQKSSSLLVEILVDDQRPCHVHFALPPKAAQKTQKDECAEAFPSGAQDGPQPCPSPLTVQTHCDASFAPRGGRRRSGILVLLVDQRTNRASLLLWQSRRQTLTALSAPEAEVVGLSGALMPAVVIHEACRDIGIEVGLSPQVLFVVKTDSQVTLAQRVSHH